MSPPPHRRHVSKRVSVAVAVVLLVGVVVFALTRLDLSRAAHDLVSASPGWLVLALALMMLSLLARSVSWHATLRVALRDRHVSWSSVARATMIGVMASAVLPGRIGEPTRIVVLNRRIEGRSASTFAIVAGTVFSQTIINLVALAVLAVVTFSSVPLLHGHASALEAVFAVPAFIALFVFGGPVLLRLARRSRNLRIRSSAIAFAGLLRLARRGLLVFARPRHGIPAVSAQLFAWALQWGACYMVILALGLQHQATPVTAAAILLAVNVTAVLPATPSNVGVFQAACLVVLAAYGIGAGPGLAYGIILQAIEILTALTLGVPALLREGMTWQDIRHAPLEDSTIIEQHPL